MKAILAWTLAIAMAAGVTVGEAGPVAAQQGTLASKGDTNHPYIDYQSRFERRGDYGYFNNHRGYRDRRPGYRYYNGYWFPPAAFLGLFLGSILGNAAVSRGGHVQWCYDTYRSYRRSDNTYQPYSGPRRQCISPYY